MSRLLHMGLVVVMALISVIGVTTLTVDRAEATSSGCSDFANVGPIITVGVTGVGTWTFDNGETILVTAKSAPVVA